MPTRGAIIRQAPVRYEIVDPEPADPRAGIVAAAGPDSKGS